MNERIKALLEEVDKLGIDEKVSAINEIKEQLKKISPFQNEPVDCVQWVKSEKVIANDYNPNTVAPPLKWNCSTLRFRKTGTPSRL